MTLIDALRGWKLMLVYYNKLVMVNSFQVIRRYAYVKSTYDT